jgi:2-oxoglutarate dehydrogenase E2 component (dihydrolipoamide succinyltransferase)
VARIAEGADRPTASAKPKTAPARAKPSAPAPASPPDSGTRSKRPVEPDSEDAEPERHDDRAGMRERAARDGETPPEPEAAEARDDVERQVAEMASERVESPPEEPETPAEEEQPTAPTRGPRKVPPSVSEKTDAVERKPMSRLRRRIAERLVEAQRTAAILTTFNEIDLSRLLAARERLRARFRERHGVDLGLVSLFGRACLQALAEVPILNARIEGDDVIYHRHVHLGIAVSTPRGLVVPVVRDADRLRFAELQRGIEDLARLARDAKLTPDQLSGGTFTITNGGVFGSLLSTPILNPPQSGILGMHKIEERPVAVDGQVVIRPMMYVALSYDHRLVDGEQAVTFLVRVKTRLEDPVRMLFEV